MTTLTHRARPALGEIFLTWLLAGAQSFGGGSSTFYLLHQAITGKGWMDEETFVRTWALAQISPGINLLKLTVLVGYYLRGWPGLLAGMAGLLIPSVSATVLMTAGFAMVRSQPLVQAALRGILPATIGLSLAMAVQMGQPLLARAHREGPARLWLQIAVIAASGLLLALWNISPLAILMASGAATIMLHMAVPARPLAVPAGVISPVGARIGGTGNAGRPDRVQDGSLPGVDSMDTDRTRAVDDAPGSSTPSRAAAASDNHRGSIENAAPDHGEGETPAADETPTGAQPSDDTTKGGRE